MHAETWSPIPLAQLSWPLCPSPLLTALWSHLLRVRRSPIFPAPWASVPGAAFVMNRSAPPPASSLPRPLLPRRLGPRVPPCLVPLVASPWRRSSGVSLTDCCPRQLRLPLAASLRVLRAAGLPVPVLSAQLIAPGAPAGDALLVEVGGGTPVGNGWSHCIPGTANP